MKRIVSTILTLTLAVAVIGQDKATIDVETSVIEWKGSKVIGNSHTGTLQFKDGVLKMKKGNLVGGEFTVDMTTLEDTDLSGGMKSKLEGHLKSDDFFGVEKYPTSRLEITKVGKEKNGIAQVSAKLTIKGTTEEITFPAEVTITDGWAIASADLTFDRSKFDVRYGSGSFFDNLGDKAISDDIELTVKIRAKTQSM